MEFYGFLAILSRTLASLRSFTELRPARDVWTIFTSMGSRQVVRHLPLEQAFGGSNPSSPATNQSAERVANATRFRATRSFGFRFVAMPTCSIRLIGECPVTERNHRVSRYVDNGLRKTDVISMLTRIERLVDNFKSEAAYFSLSKEDETESDINERIQETDTLHRISSAMREKILGLSKTRMNIDGNTIVCQSDRRAPYVLLWNDGRSDICRTLNKKESSEMRKALTEKQRSQEDLRGGL